MSTPYRTAWVLWLAKGHMVSEQEQRFQILIRRVLDQASPMAPTHGIQPNVPWLCFSSDSAHHFEVLRDCVVCFPRSFYMFDVESFYGKLPNSVIPGGKNQANITV